MNSFRILKKRNQLIQIMTQLLFLITLVNISYAQDSLKWKRTGGPPGGLGYDIRYNFAEDNIWYATDNYGGVHISLDWGIKWKPSNEGIPRQSGPSGDAIPVFSLTVDPINPMTVWAGTDITGNIYKSIDGGFTWTEKDEGVTLDYDALSFRGFTVDPSSSDIVYAMGETTNYEPGDAVWVPRGGVIFKTSDGGENWNLIWDGGIPSSLTRYMFIDPRDTEVLYVSTGIFDRGAVNQSDLDNIHTDNDPFGGLGILKSIDGGKTWLELNKDNGLNFLYIGSLFMHPENPDILLAAAGHSVPEGALKFMETGGPINHGIYRSTDGGETWTQVLKPPPERAGEVFSSVELCPTNPSIGYAGSGSAFYRTEDAGETWTLVSGGKNWGLKGVVAGTPIDLQCDPRYPNRIFANNYMGGNFLSEDGGFTWDNASSGYTGAQVISIAVDPKNPAVIYSSGRNGIWMSNDGGDTWMGVRNFGEWDSPEWSAIAIDPVNNERVLVGGEYIFETLDNGEHWEKNDLPPIYPLISVIEFAPSNSDIIYCGAAGPLSMIFSEVMENATGLVISTDNGLTWNSIMGDSLAETPILDISIDPLIAEIAFAATAKGMYYTVDMGMRWQKVEGLPSSNPFYCVEFNPSDNSHIIAGSEYSGLYESFDKGIIWKQIVNGLEPNASYRDIIFDPINSNIIYVGDLTSGVYQSKDGGENWTKINNELTTRAVTKLAISSNGEHLYAATNGEGVFRLDLSGIPVSVQKKSRMIQNLNLEINYPNPFNPVTTIEYSIPKSGIVDLRIYDLLGKEVRSLVNRIQHQGSYMIKFDANNLSSGLYFYRLLFEESVKTQKMLLVK